MNGIVQSGISAASFWASMPELLLSRPGRGWAEGDGSMFPLLVFMSHFLVFFFIFFTSCSHQEPPQTNLSPSSSFCLTQLISCPFYSIHKAPLGLFPVSSNAQLPSALSPNLIYLNQPSIFASCGSLCQTGFSGMTCTQPCDMHFVF